MSFVDFIRFMDRNTIQYESDREYKALFNKFKSN